MKACSRREVLTAAAGMSASVFTAHLARAADAAAGDSTVRPQSPKRFKISLAGYSFRQFLDQPGQPGKMSLFDLVDLCVKLGIDAIEPTAYYFLKTDDEYLYALKRKIFLAGLEISASPMRNNFCLPPGPELDKELESVRNWVDVCVKLGAPAIRIFAGKAMPGAGRDKDFERAVAGMKKACEYAGSKGIFLAIENHGYLTETADAVIKIIEAVKSDWLGINLDTGNFVEKPYENIAKAAPHAIICQFKTEVVKTPGTKEREPADFARIFKIIREAGYRGYVTLEYEGADPHKEVPIYIAKMQELAG
ncbi:MAG TPA: sugar phosphate isomerase/epimerase family protein [Phycisphaerae bacterium]|nr:sugar phosphate isomerase/epimerase family protein [Phycisphaerae bacterium]HRR85079.1 sugar phosphate isomerase/epimerase family protein [Phycisphaerae bacterium]